MRQKTIWMLLLLFGILNSFTACETLVDGNYNMEYYLVNKSGTNIVIDIFKLHNDVLLKDTYNLKNDSTLFQQINAPIGNVLGIVVYADSASIKFGSNKSVQFIAADTISPYNVLYHNNYESTQATDKGIKYTYTFTEQDVNNAIEK